MQNIFGSSERSATMQDLNEMSYLECCIKESLRLYPSVPFISRYVEKELNIGKYNSSDSPLIETSVSSGDRGFESGHTLFISDVCASVEPNVSCLTVNKI